MIPRTEIKIVVREVLAVYWREMRTQKKLFVVMVLFMVAGTALSASYPIYYKKFFDLLSTGEATPGIVSQLYGAIITIFILHFFEWLTMRGVGFADSFFSARVMADLRHRAFGSLLDHSYGFFANNFTGSLVLKVNRLARSFERCFDRFYHSLLRLAVRIIIIIGVLWHYNKFLGIAMTAYLVVFVIVNFFIARWKLPYDAARAVQDSKTTGVLADALTNHTTMQLFAARAFESNRYGASLEDWRKTYVRAWCYGEVNNGVQAFIMITFEFFLFYYAIRYWQAGVLSLGTIFLAQVYFLQLLGQLWDFGRTIRDIYESFADSQEMVDIMNMKPSIKDAPAAPTLTVSKGEVHMTNLIFYYKSSTRVLDTITIRIKPGERVAFIGPSGAGKSTLVKLLLRLYDIQKGSIAIDGQDIRSVSQESLRAMIGFVPQEPILFHRSLLENIRYGKRDASDQEVLRASHLAHCDEFIEALPNTYETLVGERGIKLSGGERQRIAIARVILKNAPLLVLDEATSSLDSHSEGLIQDALQKMMKGKTTIAIAHRLSTIRSMDRILVLNKGAICEEGNHAQLLKRPRSLYHKLWSLQSGGFIHEP